MPGTYETESCGIDRCWGQIFIIIKRHCTGVYLQSILQKYLPWDLIHKKYCNFSTLAFKK